MIGKREFRIGWVGFHEEGELAFNALVERGYFIAGAVTLDSESVSKRSGASSYLEKCNSLGIPLHKTSHINHEETYQWLERLELDLLIVLGWSQILSPKILSLASIGVIGAHASLLPKMKGSAPINWAIIRGLSETGNSLIELVEDVDGGQIIDQVSFPITRVDTCKTLYEKVAESNKIMLLRSIPYIMENRAIKGTPQSLSLEHLLPRRKPSDGLIDWSHDAWEIYNLIRGVTRPYPGAFTFIDGRKVFVWSATFLPVPHSARNVKPGQVLGPVYSSSHAACGILIACGRSSALILNEVEIDRVYQGEDLVQFDWNNSVLGGES